MSNRPNGGPAFPQEIVTTNFNEHTYAVARNTGMSLRDYFAAAAMTGLLANPRAIETVDPEGKDPSLTAEEIQGVVAFIAYSHADAMLAMRPKGGGA